MSLLLTFGKKSVIQRAISVLRKFGTDAHAYIPGVGVLNGMTAGNYTDTAGTQFTTKDQPVGLDLDAMGTTSFLSVPQDLTTWTSGGAFGSWSGTTATASTITATAPLAARRVRYPITPGTQVNVSATVIAGTTTGSVWVVFGTSVPAYISAATSATVASGYVSTGLVAPSNAAYVEITVRATDSGGTVGFTGISASTKTGIHATQGTAGNKPVLRHGLVCRNYPSGDITLWSTTAAGTITGGQADPVGGTSAQLFSGANKNVYITAGVASGVLSGLSFTHAAHLYSPTGGTLTMGSAAGGAKTTLVTIPAGWSIATAYWTATETNGPLLNLNGSLTSVTVYRQGIYLGTVTASQILAAGGIPLTTSAKASAGTGPSYWEFGGDGTPTDYLSLGSVPFQMSDDFVVVASITSRQASGWGTIFGLSGAGTTPRIQVYINASGGVLQAYFRDSAGATMSGAGGVADIRSAGAVVSMRKIGTSVVCRVNGIQTASFSVAILGVATFTGADIGRLYGGTDYFAGDINSEFVVKATVTDADLLLIEKLAANLAGVTLA